jgi:hypothetical protein
MEYSAATEKSAPQKPMGVPIFFISLMFLGCAPFCYIVFKFLPDVAFSLIYSTQIGAPAPGWTPAGRAVLGIALVLGSITSIWKLMCFIEARVYKKYDKLMDGRRLAYTQQDFEVHFKTLGVPPEMAREVYLRIKEYIPRNFSILPDDALEIYFRHTLGTPKRNYLAKEVNNFLVATFTETEFADKAVKVPPAAELTQIKTVSDLIMLTAKLAAK